MDMVSNLLTQHSNMDYFIFGGTTCFAGVLLFLFLVGDPQSQYWNFNAENQILVDKCIQDNTVIKTTAVKNNQIIEALKEICIWAIFVFMLLVGITLSNLANQAVAVWGHLVSLKVYVQRQHLLKLHWTRHFVGSKAAMAATMLIMVLWSVCAACLFCQTLYVACGFMFIYAVGITLSLTIPVLWIKIISLILSSASVAVYVLIQAALSNNVSSYIKRFFVMECG